MSMDNDRIVLYTAFTALWESETTPYRFDKIQSNDSITESGNPWIRTFLKPGITTQKNIGSNSVLFRSAGNLFVFEIYAREEEGPADIYRIADKIKLGFLGKSFDNGKIRITRSSLDTRSPYKGWASKALTLAYVVDEFVQRQ